MDSLAGSLERLLDLEIKRREEQWREGGWSEWVIVAAMAAAIWAVVDLAAGQRPNWTLVSVHVVLFLPVMLWSRAVFYGLVSDQIPSPEVLRFRPSGVIAAPGRRTGVLMLVLSILVGVVVICTAARFYLVGAVRWGILLGAAVCAVFGLLPLAASATSFAMPELEDMPRPLWASVFAQCVIGVPVAASAGALELLWLGGALELRLSLLFVALIALLWRLAVVVVRDPLVYELLAIRRGLGAQRITPDEARRRYELVTEGYRLPDVVAPELANLLEHRNRALALLQGVRAQAAIARAAMQELRSSSEKEQPERALLEETTKLVEMMKHFTAAHKAMLPAAGKIVSRAIAITALFPGAQASRRELGSLLRAEYDLLEDDWVRVSTDLESFLADTRQLVAREATEPQEEAKKQS